MSQITDALDAATAKAEALTTVNASAISLLGSLAAALRENANAPAKINELAAGLERNAADMAAAIVANTPTDPVPPPPIVTP